MTEDHVPVGEVIVRLGRETAEAIRTDLRGRRTLKWFFGDADQSMIVCSHFEAISQEVQDDILGAWAKIIAAALAAAEAPVTPAEEPLNHEDACRLSRIFNSAADLRIDEDRRINDWLKGQIARAALPLLGAAS